MALLTIEEAPRAGKGGKGWQDHPMLALGFRPFYPLAAAFAAVSVPAWLASYYGLVSAQRIDLAWHVHEMLFGFVLAVIIGFLFTAARNWTGLWTPRRGTLAAIAGVWIAGRLAMLAAPLPLAAAVDLAFVPVAGFALFRVLLRSGNWRNMFLVVLLSLLTGVNAVFHAALLGWLDLSPVHAVHAGLAIVVIIEAVIGGRVIPMFTANAVPGVNPVKNERRDAIGLGFTAAAGLAWALGAPAPFAAALALCAACAQTLRLAGWKPWRTLNKPLLWILHISYAWIPAGFLVLAFAHLGLAPISAAVHLLAVGATGGLIIGMITRTALGHTGRPLSAGRAEAAMYLLVQGGVLARLLAAFSVAGLRDGAMITAGLLWSAGFLLYLWIYVPYLAQPRVDGKEG